jgi:hypothetical protein
MHENEEAPEGYMEKEKEKEKRENWVAEREEMYWVLKRVDRERERVVLGRMQLPQRTFNC